MTTFDQLFGDESGPLSQPFDPRPVMLESAGVRLEPLAMEHAEDLWEAGKVDTLWRYLPDRAPRSLEDMRAWIGCALEEVEARREVAYATVHIEDGCAVGSTRFMDFRREDRGLEIGWTWIGIHYQRTAVNTHAKYLMLQHAFETLGAIRVQFKTDRRNRQSQTAIERVGARREGTLRNHMILHDGYYRDTVMFSVTLKAWPEVKKQLQLRLL